MKSLLNILFVAIVVFTSCKKKEDSPVDNSTSTTGGASSGLNNSTAEYVNFTIGAANYSYTPPSNGLWATGYTPTIFIQPSSPNYIYTSKSVYSNNNIVFGLTLADTTLNTGSVSDALFRKFVADKAYKYATSSTQNTINSLNVRLNITDNTSVSWSTVKPSGTTFQTGSNFAITETGEYTQQGNSTITRKFKAVFNCKLYNNLGDSTTLSNGQLILSITK